MDLSKTRLIESVFAGGGEMGAGMRALDWVMGEERLMHAPFRREQPVVSSLGVRFSLRVNELANGRRSWIHSHRRLSERSVNRWAGAASVRTTAPISKYDGAPPEGVLLSFT
jgi:hypothetical protein